MKPERKLFWMYLVKALALPFFFLVLKYKIHGSTAIRDKNAIIAVNHTGAWDFPLLSVVFFRRRLRVLTSKRVMECPPFAQRFLRYMGVVPMTGEPGAGLEELFSPEYSEDLPCFFPEGRISPDGRLLPFKTGCAIMALELGARVIPVYMKVSSRLFRRTHIAIGEPVELPSTDGAASPEDITAATRLLEVKMNGLREIVENEKL